MTTGEDPADGGNRTVFRPSPLSGLGGARPAPAPAPPPAQSAAPEAGQAGAAVAPPAPPPPPPAPRQPRLSDEGIPAPPTPREIRAPLASEAGPLLALAASVRSGRARIGMADFDREAREALVVYDRAIAPHYPEETRHIARNLLAATIDDIARNLPSLDGAPPWEGRSLIQDAAGASWKEDELWTQLDHALEKAEDNTDLIELAHACLAAGFQGRYRGQPGGGEELEKWSERLFKSLDHVRALSQRFVSPQWVGFNAPLQKVPTVSIIALAAVAALVLIVLAYFVLRETGA